MATKSYFEEIGILGWDGIEPIILAAMLGNKAVLLKGPHGANKTEGCGLIAEAVYGDGTKFVPYDTSLVAADDLMGFLHPKKLAEGVIEYVPTPDSIEDATCCLLDEINRCNPYAAAKFFEIVRSRTINGRATALQFVFAACNPPDRYNTAHMDAAQVSRFVCLEVPVFHDLAKDHKNSILDIEPAESAGALKDHMARARAASIPKTQLQAIRGRVLKIADTLNKIDDVHFSGRQVRDLYKLLCNMDRVSQVFDEIKTDDVTLCTAVLGLVPEATGLLRTKVDVTRLETEIKTLFHGFKLSDPVVTATSLTEMCQAEIRDTHGHAAAIADYLDMEEDTAEIDRAWQAITERKNLPRDMFDKLRRSFASRSAVLKVGKNVKIEEVAAAIKVELANYGPKPSRKGRRKS